MCMHKKEWHPSIYHALNYNIQSMSSSAVLILHFQIVSLLAFLNVCKTLLFTFIDGSSTAHQGSNLLIVIHVYKAIEDFM